MWKLGLSFSVMCSEIKTRPIKLEFACGVPGTRSSGLTPYKLTQRGSILPSRGRRIEMFAKSLCVGCSGKLARKLCC